MGMNNSLAPNGCAKLLLSKPTLSQLSDIYFRIRTKKVIELHSDSCVYYTKYDKVDDI